MKILTVITCDLRNIPIEEKPPHMGTIPDLSTGTQGVKRPWLARGW